MDDAEKLFKDTSEQLYEWRLNQEEVGGGVEKNEEDFEETTEEIEEVEQLMRWRNISEIFEEFFKYMNKDILLMHLFLFCCKYPLENMFSSLLN